MEYVQPIRDKKIIERFKIELKKNSFRNYMLFMTGINTGLRISDIIKLKVCDMSNTHIQIKEQKTDKHKRVLINSSLRKDLNEYTNGMNDNDYLFPSKKGDYITRIQAYRILNDVAVKIGINEVGTHTLRKTFGYWYYQQYHDVAMLQELFNHSSPSVTLRYIGINQDILDESMRDFSL